MKDRSLKILRMREAFEKNLDSLNKLPGLAPISIQKIKSDDSMTAAKDKIITKLRNSEYPSGAISVIESSIELTVRCNEMLSNYIDYINNKEIEDCRVADIEKRAWKAFVSRWARWGLSVVLAVLLYSVFIYVSENLFQLENGKGFIRIPVADWFRPAS